MYPPDSLLGDIGIFRNQTPDQTDNRSSMSLVRTMISPAPGHEAEGENKIAALESKIILFSESESLNLPAMVRDALLMPTVSKLLGYSDFAGPTTIPKWLAHPTIRLAHLVQTGLICDQLKIRAARVPFGGISLLSAAFSVKPAEDNVYEYASFVLTGAFGLNASSFLETNPRTFLEILAFRETAEGQALRREIADRLETNDGSEFSAAIEGGLSRAIPPKVLQSARDKFSIIIKTANTRASTSTIWAGLNNNDMSLRRWRERSRELLWTEAKKRNAKSTSPCICGSGDAMQACCLRPLI
jgi:hypothetical protein